MELLKFVANGIFGQWRKGKCDEVGARAITTTSTSRRKFHKAGWHIFSITIFGQPILVEIYIGSRSTNTLSKIYIQPNALDSVLC